MSNVPRGPRKANPRPSKTERSALPTPPPGAKPPGSSGFAALLADVRALQQRATAMSPRRATRVEFVRWLAAALHFGRSLLDRAEAEGRELRVDWSLEALNDPEPFTARLVLMPKAVSPGEDARR